MYDVLKPMHVLMFWTTKVHYRATFSEEDEEVKEVEEVEEVEEGIRESFIFI